MAPRILIFSMAMGADYSFELISIETYVPQFIGHNKFFLGSVINKNSENFKNFYKVDSFIDLTISIRISFESILFSGESILFLARCQLAANSRSHFRCMKMGLVTENQNYSIAVLGDLIVLI